jgi:hypothetical protein
MVSRAVKWWVAGLVTAVSFSVAAWVAGVFVLPPLMKSAADRWAVAAGLGAAVAAFAALWGQWWATRDVEQQQAPRQQAGDRSIQIGGSQHGGMNVTGDENTISDGGPGPA